MATRSDIDRFGRQAFAFRGKDRFRSMYEDWLNGRISTRRFIVRTPRGEGVRRLLLKKSARSGRLVEITGQGGNRASFRVTFSGELESTTHLEPNDSRSNNAVEGIVAGGIDIAIGTGDITVENTGETSNGVIVRGEVNQTVVAPNESVTISADGTDGEEKQPNFRITAVQAQRRNLRPGESTRVVVRAENTGDAPAQRTTDVLVDGEVIGQLEWSIPPGETAEQVIRPTFQPEPNIPARLPPQARGRVPGGLPNR